MDDSEGLAIWPPRPVQWEYKVFNYTGWGTRHIEEELNALGNQGWELVHPGGTVFYFKRPRKINGDF